MDLKILADKIFLKRYLISSIGASLVLAIYFRDEPGVAASVFIIHIASLLNHILLGTLIVRMLAPENAGKPDARQFIKMTTFFSLKILILGGSFGICVQFVDDKIVIPLSNYILQIFILAFCLKRK